MNLLLNNFMNCVIKNLMLLLSLKLKEWKRFLVDIDSPLTWESNISWGKTKFSFKEKYIVNAILSNVNNTDRAITYNPEHGPQFGIDIAIYASSESADYNSIWCKNLYYCKKIRDSTYDFSMEDYEIFQIIRR